MSKKKTSLDHTNCECVVAMSKFTNTTHMKPGLWCKGHGSWIKWLSWQDYDQLVLMGVEELGVKQTKADIKRSKITL